MGSAGLYLEDYFEEQLKKAYPDRLFPGGREEQMIPPLEDEIDDDEEETMAQGTAPLENETAQSPAGKGIPPVEEDFHVEEAATEGEKENSETEKQIDVSNKGTDAKVGFVLKDETTTEQEVESSAAAASETSETSSSPKESSPVNATDKSADPPEAQEKESTPAGTHKEEE